MLIHFAHSLAAGIITAVILYVIYEKKSASIWGFFSGVLVDLPFIILTPFGVTNLGLLMLFSHTIGIFIFPLALVLIDILLIELRMVKRIRPISFLLPKGFKSAIKAEMIVEKFQLYGLIPQPIRIRRVYTAGVIAGVVHLLINASFGGVL